MIPIPRIEQKLELDKFAYYKLLIWLRDNKAISPYPERIICSTYFDTIDLKMYKDTHEGIVPRKKIRIRTYNSRNFENSIHPYNLEVKITAEDKRYKSIVKDIMVDNFIKFGHYDNLYGFCYPQVQISYIREYFLFKDLRVTLDKEIIYRFAGLGKALIYRDVKDEKYVFEVKADIKTSLDEILQKLDFQRTTFSKYERGMYYLFQDN